MQSAVAALLHVMSFLCFSELTMTLMKSMDIYYNTCI
jgi:hypothetical protein